MKLKQSMHAAGLALIASVLLAGASASAGCRRNADDKGVGTSSVGAGGANGQASNNDRQAEPVKGTDQEDATTRQEPIEKAGENRGREPRR